MVLVEFLTTTYIRGKEIQGVVPPPSVRLIQQTQVSVTRSAVSVALTESSQEHLGESRANVCQSSFGFESFEFITISFTISFTRIRTITNKSISLRCTQPWFLRADVQDSRQRPVGRV